MTTNEHFLDRGIRHSVFLERLKVSESKKIVQLLDKEVIPDVRQQLERLSSAKFGSKRLKQIEKSLEGIVKGGIRSSGKVLQKNMGDLAVTEAEFQRKLFKDLVPLEIDFRLPSGLRSIVVSEPFQGRFLRTWFSQLGVSTQQDLMQQINIGLVQGEAIPTIVRRLTGRSGLFNQTKRKLTSITRTAVNHVSAQAREMTYEANKDVVKQVQWVSTLDHRTTEICMSLDGRVFDIGAGLRPPAHHQCRSTTIPVLKSWDELGIPLKEIPETTRASMDGQVPAKLTYPQWLKQQNKTVQNQALGKGKAELFRQGKLDITKFNGVGDRPLTLEQLRRREGLTPRPELRRAKTIDEWLQNLNKAEKEAIHRFTGSSSSGMKQVQVKGETDLLSHFVSHTRAMEVAMRKSPIIEQTTYRGMANLDPSLASAFSVKDRVIEFESFTSTSAKQSMAKGFGRSVSARGLNWVEFEIRNKVHPSMSIQSLSQYPEEAEIVFNKGAKFRVVKSKFVQEGTRHGSGYEIVLESI